MDIIENAFNYEGFTSKFSLAVMKNLCSFLKEKNKKLNTAEIGYYKGRTTSLVLNAGSENHIIIDRYNSPLEEHLNDSRVRFFKKPSRFIEPDLYKDFGSLDFIFLDGGHNRTDLWNDLSLANKLLSYEGILLVDDINYELFPELVKCLDEYCALTEDFFKIALIDSRQMILARSESFLEYYKYCFFFFSN